MKERDVNRGSGKIIKGLAAGLAGGLAATFVMTQFQYAVTQISRSLEKEKGNEKSKSDSNSKEENDQSENATVKMAEKISENVFDHKLQKSEKELAGNALHYTFGTTMGGLYGMAAEIAPISKTGNGILFGTLLFLGADEIAVPAAGLSGPPAETPVSTHAYGLVSHLVYGLTADFVRRSVRRIL